MTTAVNTGAPMVLRLAQGAGRRTWGPSVFLAVVVGAFLATAITGWFAYGWWLGTSRVRTRGTETGVHSTIVLFIARGQG